MYVCMYFSDRRRKSLINRILSIYNEEQRKKQTSNKQKGRQQQNENTKSCSFFLFFYIFGRMEEVRKPLGDLPSIIG